MAVTRNGQPFESGEVRSDADEHPDTLAVGDVKLLLLKRGERMALRIKDNRSPIRAGFAGLRWYPANEEWQITGRVRRLSDPDQADDRHDRRRAGRARQPGRRDLRARGEDLSPPGGAAKGGALWFVFRDGTSGRHHPRRRPAAHDRPAAGDEVILDFNKAVNLPCAYIPYATCPLAPPQNRLGLAIEAGEKIVRAREAGRPRGR